MEFSEHQRLFLAAVCNHFHQTGTWPTNGSIDRLLRPYKGLDVEEVGKELDDFMHDSFHAPLSGWDPKRIITMNVSALYMCWMQGICPELKTDLTAFMDAITLCIQKYEVGNEDEAITASELLEPEPNPDYWNFVVGSTIQLIMVEGFYISANYDQNRPAHSPASWSFTMPHAIRKYRDVRSIDDYLAVRAQLLASAYGFGALMYTNTAGQLFEHAAGQNGINNVPSVMSAAGEDVRQSTAQAKLKRRTKAKPKIFVSHSTKDTSFATKLVQDLSAAGTQAWMDVNDLGAGNFQERIDKALADCEWFLLVLTRNALASEWVRQEVYAANRLKNQGKIKQLVFIKAGEVEHGELPPMWGVFNIFDALSDYEDAVARTLKEVGSTVAATPTP
jgi:TIR domain-containing protein